MEHPPEKATSLPYLFNFPKSKVSPRATAIKKELEFSFHN